MAPKGREVGIRLSVKDAEVAKRALEAFGKDGQAALKRIEGAGRPASVSLHALNAASGSAKAAIGGFVSGAIAGLVPMLSLSAAISGTRAALEKFGAIADKSKSAGLDPEFFQGVAHAAKLAGVEVDATAAALGLFAQNSGLAAEGRGKMVKALKDLNPELLRNIQLATTQEQRVRLAADAINAATSAAEKAALTNALFGNRDMAAAFEGGAAALDSAIAKARDLGLIVDRDVIARADELGDAFDTAAEIVDNNLKQALINLAPGLANFAGWVAIISGNIRDMVDATKALEDRSSATLNNQLRDLGKADVDLENRAIGVQGRLNNPSFLDQLNRGALEAELAKIKAEREANQAAQKAILGQLETRTPVEPVVPLNTDLPPSDEAKAALKEAEALVKRLQTAAEEYAATVADLDQKQAAGLITQETHNRGVAEAALKFAQAADTTDQYAQALARLDDAKARGIITEKQYTDAVESLTKQRLIAQNDWVAGIQLGLQQIQSGADEVTNDVAQAVSGWAESLGEQIGEVFRTGKFSWQDLVKTMLADIAKLATQQFITRPLAGLLGNIFGGLLGGGGGGLTPQPVTNIGFGTYGSYDTGGWTGDGSPSDPAGMVHRKEFVVKAGPASRYRDTLEAMNSGRSMGFGAGNFTLAPTYNVDGSGLSPAQLLAVLDQHSSMLLDRVSSIVKRDVKNGVFA